MRLIRVLIALGCLVVGAVVGALNRDLVQIDLAFARLGTTLGVALLVALLSGVILGGAAITASLVLPLRRRIARLERERAGAPRTPPTPAGAETGGGR